MSSDYIHGYSPEEMRRLTRMQEILNHEELAALDLSGVRKLLDVGAGLGQMTRAMARALAPASANPADDNAQLLVTKVPGGSIQLHWAGDSPPYEMYCDLAPQELVEFGNRLGTTEGTSWSDTPPASDIVYYLVNPTGRCTYATADATVDSTTPGAVNGEIDVHSIPE